jgi:hypothetical protein
MCRSKKVLPATEPYAAGKGAGLFSDSEFFWVRGGFPFVAEMAALQGFEAAHPPYPAHPCALKRAPN